MVTSRSAKRADEGGILILTLILVVVLAAVVLALASFVTVGLKTADVASERTDTNADSSSVMNWAIEEFAKKQLRPDDSCGDAPSYLSIVVPAGLVSNGSTTTLECAQTDPIAGEPVVHLIAASTGDQNRIVEATVEVPLYTHGARIADWRVDIPIAVPAYVTTTTIAAPNVAPVALDMTIDVNPSTTTTFTLNATDSDGTIVSSNISGAPGTWTVTSTGTSVDLTVDATEATTVLTYTVTDDDSAVSASANLTVNVTSAATTTTTLAPMPSCVFQITSAAGDEKSGIGTLSVSNTGGDFTGWQLGISWPGSWDGTWDGSVTVNGGSPTNTVSGGQTVANGATLNFNVALTWTGGNPKIVSGSTRTCTMISPP